MGKGNKKNDKTLIYKIKSFIRRLFKHPIKTLKWTLIRLYAKLKRGGKRLILIFALVWLAFASPTIVGYILYYLSENAWHLTYANAWFAFWMFAPGTPMIPLCIVIAVAINGALNRIFFYRKGKQGSLDENIKPVCAKIGIFGGTFDPPHNAHVELVRQATKQLGLISTIVVPNGDAPHKLEQTDKMHRLAMTELAFSNMPIKVSLDEVLKEGKTYSVDTIKAYSKKFDKFELVFILGGDSFLSFDSWYQPEEIAKRVSFAVAVRNKSIQEKAKQIREKYNATVYELKPIEEISSTEMRLAIEMGIDVSDKMDSYVLKYISRNELYVNDSEFLKRLKWYLDGDRYLHTFYTAVKGLEYAQDINIDKEKALTACLLHDCAKQIANKTYDNYQKISPQVRHAFIGADIAEKEFGVCDEDILNAIRYHTTGRANMSQLEKLVYLADITEKSRGRFAQSIRKTYEKFGFDHAFREAIKISYNYLKTNVNEEDICQLTVEAYNFYCQ